MESTVEKVKLCVIGKNGDYESIEVPYYLVKYAENVKGFFECLDPDMEKVYYFPEKIGDVNVGDVPEHERPIPVSPTLEYLKILFDYQKLCVDCDEETAKCGITEDTKIVEKIKGIVEFPESELLIKIKEDKQKFFSVQNYPKIKVLMKEIIVIADFMGMAKVTKDIAAEIGARINACKDETEIRDLLEYYIINPSVNGKKNDSDSDGDSDSEEKEKEKVNN